MASTTIVIEHTEDIRGIASGARKESVRALINALEGYTSGAKRAKTLEVMPNNSEALAAASGTVTISSGSGAITITINGVTAASETWATDDATTATALAADINASTDALVQNLVTASAAAGVVTVTAVQKGRLGNAITLATSGTGSTASGARLTGGTGGKAAAVSFTF